ncbi:MAG: RNA-binding protein, partial [Nitrosopumilaceae archaeon]|nr:RNA-binding protein [Nitrosopumilaceae archaeon]
MTTKKVKTSLNEISKTLSKTQDMREFLLKNTREVITICSRAIISVHKNDIKSAKSKLAEAEKLLKKFRSKSTIDVQKYLITPEQEFVEAASLIAISEKKEIP